MRAAVIAAIVIFSFVGCGGDEYKETYTCEHASPYNLGHLDACGNTLEAISIINDAFVHYDYVAVPEAHVTWHPGKCVYYSRDAEGQDYCIFGIVSGACEIDIAWDWGYGAILSHELMHCSLAMVGDTDRDHVNDDAWYVAEELVPPHIKKAGL